MGERVKTVLGNKASRPIEDFMLGIVGTEYYVGPNATGAGDDGRSGRSKKTSLATLEAAITKATASKNDIIYLLPGHAETVATAGAISLDKIGLQVIGLGTGALRPKFTFSAVDATMTITAASCVLENVVLAPSIDSVVSPIVVSAADCRVDVEIQDTTDIECVAGILTTADADRIDINLVYRGYIGGNACVNGIRLVGCNGANINVDFYGKASTAIVEFHTTECYDINIKGYFYNSGTTDLSKNVIDTKTSGTWFVSGYDGAAGAAFSGGSGNAIAAGDLSAIATSVASILADTGTDGVVLEADSIAAAKIADDAFSEEHFDGDAVQAVTMGKKVSKATAALAGTSTVNLFTVATGRVVVHAIVGQVTTIVQTQATVCKLISTPTVGTAVDLCGTLDLTADEAGCLYGITGLTADALVGTNAGATICPKHGVIVPVGVIGFNNASAVNTGSVKWDIYYTPLDTGATIVSA